MKQVAAHSAGPFVEVLIIGAGISGIGFGCELRRSQPGRSFAILEARSAIGGTWDLFKYPGVRSDSDLYTFGYAFKPWDSDRPLASGQSILRYLAETVREHDLARHIRFGHRVLSASFSRERAEWRVECEVGEAKERRTYRCRWLCSASGYYRYDRGHTPDFAGAEGFEGRIVHPQSWPEDLNVSGKRVVVIGSGATAVTLVPALAEQGAHVTMLQRTPSYVMSVPSEDGVAKLLRRVLPSQRAHALIRRKNIALQSAVYQFCMRYPKAARRMILAQARRQLPPGYPVHEHFDPPYDPWRQRLCACPDGDFFAAIRRGAARVVTDHIERFTARGVLLASGSELPADVIVTATGLALQPMAGLALTVDGEPVHYPMRIAYKGMMLTRVPNFVFAIGYVNASWTLKVGLVAEHFSRILSLMESGGHTLCEPVLGSPQVTRPMIDFEAGYFQRALKLLPLQGSRAPFKTSSVYADDVAILRDAPVEDPNLQFSAPQPSADARAEEASA